MDSVRVTVLTWFANFANMFISVILPGLFGLVLIGAVVKIAIHYLQYFMKDGWDGGGR
jgi:hypothetical protein